jgi:hypothetical protein
MKISLVWFKQFFFSPKEKSFFAHGQWRRGESPKNKYAKLKTLVPVLFCGDEKETSRSKSSMTAAQNPLPQCLLKIRSLLFPRPY